MAFTPRPRPDRRGWSLAVLATTVLSAGCASLSPEAALAPARPLLSPMLPAGAAASLQALPAGPLSAERQAQVNALLARPLDADAALQLALLQSPSLQALLARHQAEAAEATQAGRLPNPVLGLERLRGGGELEIARSLSVGLMELLSWPQRQRSAEQRSARQPLQLAAELIDQIGAVRNAWVSAVAAQQALAYARQVHESAQAGAELARRMQVAGNLNASARARQAVFAADATAALAEAEHQALASREALVRQLGLDATQAQGLQLPGQLPALPAQLPDSASVQQRARDARLDLRLARAELATAAADAGWGQLSSWTDVELEGLHQSVFEAGAGHVNQRGLALSLRLPLFDSGDARRQALAARVQAAAWQLQAAERAAHSQLREAESAWRSAWAVARQYRDELVPLRKTLADESLLRYNGMLIGVFELLADAREQAGTVQATIAAEARFWRADAALQAQLLGRPPASGATATTALPRASSGASADGH